MLDEFLQWSLGPIARKVFLLKTGIKSKEGNIFLPTKIDRGHNF